MNRWNNIAYQNINTAELADKSLFVQFENGDKVEVPLQQLLPYVSEEQRGEINIDDIRVSSYEINLGIDKEIISIPWDKIRVLTDRDYSRFLADKAEEQAKLIGVKLKRLRERKGFKSNDLSERSGITAQTISRIEKGHQDISFTTLRKLLVSMGYSLKDLANEEIELEKEGVGQKDYGWLLKKLSKAGVDANLITKKIIPKRLQLALTAYSNNQPELLLDEAASYVSNIYGWTINDIWSNSDLSLLKSPATEALFKKTSNANLNQIKAYAHYAFHLAKIILKASNEKKKYEYPEDIDEFKEILNTVYGGINVSSILNYAWDMNICVLPLNDSGIFHGAAWNVKGRHVVILKQQTASHARWIFDLLHELYHVFDHLSSPDDNIIEVAEISPTAQDEDIREREANSFANQVIFNGKAEELAQEVVSLASWKIENLKAAVLEVAEKENVRQDSLANYVGYRLGHQGKNWWGTVDGLQEKHPDPFEITKDILVHRTSLNTLAPIEQNLISTALNI